MDTKNDTLPQSDQLEATMDAGGMTPDLLTAQRTIIEHPAPTAVSEPAATREDSAVKTDVLKIVRDQINSIPDSEIASDRFNLEGLMKSEAWQNLQPNFSSPEHLLPHDLTPEQLNEIAAFLDNTDTRKQARLGDISISLAHGGSLRKIGEGESKIAFLYTNDEGKQVVVHLQNGYNFKSIIPPDPRISLGYSLPLDLGQQEIHAYYSDARTYLQFPLSDDGEKKMGATIQEYLGASIEGEGFLTKMKNRGKVKDTEEKAVEYTRSHGWKIEDPKELAFRRNYFAPQGTSGPRAVIDIPVTRIARS